jgi:hypothetical protein
MKITLELDPTLAPDETKDPQDVATPETAESAKPEPTKQTTLAPPPARPAKKTVAEQPQAKKEESGPEAISRNSSFALQGGVNQISDPDRDKEGVFKFVAPRGAA